jgi:RNA polymerase sigma-70 factor (ECF subfamily)
MFKHSNREPHLTLVAESFTKELSDTELVVRAQAKDQRAFELLVKRHQSLIKAHLYQLAPESNDRSDLEQEVLIRIWRSIGSLKNPASFRSWLRQIATNIFYDSLRKKPALRVISLDEPMNSENGDENATRDIQDKSAMPEDVMQRAELLKEIEVALAKLPEQFRTAMILREMHGLSYEEIANITNSEKGTVKSRISRARDKVQLSMSPYFKDCA